LQCEGVRMRYHKATRLWVGVKRGHCTRHECAWIYRNERMRGGGLCGIMWSNAETENQARMPSPPLRNFGKIRRKFEDRGGRGVVHTAGKGQD